MTTERYVIEVSENGTRRVRRNLEDLSRSSRDANASIDLLKNTLATLGIGVGIGELAKLADEYTSLVNRLKLVTTSTENLTAVNKALFESANRTMNAYGQVVNVFTKVSSAGEQLGLSQAKVLKITESINLAATLSGTGAVNAEQGLRQLGQALGSGKLNGDELVSILENVPRVAKVIADGMGVPIGALKKLGEEGKLTSDVIVKAFEKAEQQLVDEFANTVPTIGNALTVLKNNVLRTFGELDQSSGASRIFAEALIGLSGNMDILVRATMAAAIVLGTQFAVQGIGAALVALRALSVAILANPIGMIAKGVFIAIAALTAFSDAINIGGGNLANLADLGIATFETLKGGITSVVTFISSKLPDLSNVFRSVFGDVNVSVSGIFSAAARGVDFVVGAFKGMASAIPMTFSGMARVIEIIFNNIFNSILRSSAAWMNLIIGQINKVGSMVGLSAISQVQAVQIPLSNKSKELGKNISTAISKGINEEKSAQNALNKILDRANQIAKERAAISQGSINNAAGTPIVPPGGGGSGKGGGKSQAETDAERFIKALREEEIQIGKTKTELALLKAEELGVMQQAKPLIDSIERKTKALEAQEAATKKLAQDVEAVRRITEETQTPQERFNATVLELNRLLTLPAGKGLTIETYNRALKNAQAELVKTQNRAKDAFGSIDQYAIQAARNIQTSLANFLFDPFEDGLEGMVKGVIDAVRRMAAEFAAMKIAQMIGLPELFGMMGGMPGGTASTGNRLFGLASAGSSVGNLFGLRGPVAAGNVTQQLAARNSLKMWGTTGGLPMGGPGMGRGLSSMGSMAGMMGMAGPLLGAAGGLFMGHQIGSMIAGDKKILGMNGDITAAIGTALGGPIGAAVAGGITALFGHGPMKFRQEVITGKATEEGFTGKDTFVHRAKGGLFVGNKHKLEAAPHEEAVIKLIDDATKGFAAASRSFAENLGVSTTSIDNYSRTIRLESEKKEQLTEEAIRELIDSIGEDLAKGILDQMGVVAEYGETSVQALKRVNDEFNTLNFAALSAGRSLNEARLEIEGLSVAARSELVDKLGGVDVANANIQFFIDNFLNNTQKLKPLFEDLSINLNKLGFSANMTKEEFVALIQSTGKLGGITTEQFAGLMNLVQDFFNVDKLREEVRAQEEANAIKDKAIEGERELSDIRSDLTQAYERQKSSLQGTIDKFRGFADRLKEFRQGLLTGDLSPLTPQQKLEESRTNFLRLREKAKTGDEEALEKLPQAAEEFLRASQTVNASGQAFTDDFNMVQNILRIAESNAKEQINYAQKELDALESNVTNLIDISANTKTTTDLLREIAVKILNGEGNPNISSQQIQDFIRNNPQMTNEQFGLEAAKHGISKQQLIDAGVDPEIINKTAQGMTVTDKQIRDFVNSGANNHQIYDAARRNGVTFDRLSKVMGWKLSDIQNWAKANNLPFLDTGTDFVTRGGLAMLHKGETVGPSSMPGLMRDLIEEVAELRREQAEQTARIIQVTAITNKQNAESINDNTAKTTREQLWQKKNGTKRK